MYLRIRISSADPLLRFALVGLCPSACVRAPPRPGLMLRNVKRIRAGFGPQLTAIPMTSYPFGADRTELEKAFSLPSVSPAAAAEPGAEGSRFSESERAVALFEHPDH